MPLRLLKLLDQKQSIDFSGRISIIQSRLFLDQESAIESIDFDPSVGISKRIFHYAHFTNRTQKPSKFFYIRWIDSSNVLVPFFREISFTPVDTNVVNFKISKRLSLKIEDVIPKLNPDLMDSLNDVVVLSEAEPVDHPGPRVLYVNKTFEKMTGFAKNDIIGSTPRILQRPETDQTERNKIRKALKEWDSVTAELKNFKKNGNPFYVELSITPVADETGWYTHWVAIQRDVTSRKEEQEKLNILIENFPGVVYQFKKGADGQVSFPFFSQKGLALYEVTTEELANNPEIFIELVAEEDRPGLIEAIEASARSLDTFHWTGRLRLRSGSTKWIEGKSFPIKTVDGAILWSGVLWDITVTKELELKLKEKTAFENHNKRLSFIGEIAAGIGHEIRTPLAIANGQVERISHILKNNFEIQNTDALKCVEKYNKASPRIEKIVNGLRILSRKDSDVLGLADANEITFQVYDFLHELYMHEGVELTAQISAKFPKFIGDIGLLQQCLLNLLSNAKDAVQNTIVKKINIIVENPNDKSITIKVADTGTGIPDAIIDRIFDPFFTTKPAGQGTGIGLSTTVGLINRMNGRLEVIRKEVGTEFEIILPVVDSKTLVPQSQKSKLIPTAELEKRIEPSSGLNALIVEDEYELLKYMGEIVVGLGFNVKLASNGFEALEQIAKDKFDLIVTDLRMPIVDGHQLLEKIKLLQQNRPRLICVTTGEEVIPNEKKVINYDSGEIVKLQHLQKPIDLTAFKKNVTQFFGTQN